ncbi:MAG: hypothetical protein ACRCZF_13825, partial [Gemmataceae bacterium]
AVDVVTTDRAIRIRQYTLPPMGRRGSPLPIDDERSAVLVPYNLARQEGLELRAVNLFPLVLHSVRD